MSYPQACYSAYCGKVLCDGCEVRPALVRFYKSKGELELEAYETRQAELRADKLCGRGIWAPIGS